MKRMTYKTLMRKCEEGRVEVTAWSGNYAEVTIWPADMSKRPTREHIEVTKVPANVQN